MVRRKLVHGSDWPIISIPPRRIGVLRAAGLLWSEANWMRRDVLAKRALGFDEAYWHRAASLLPAPMTRWGRARRPASKAGPGRKAP